MDPLSIAAIGWIMSCLVNQAVTVLLEAWAKRIGIGKEFKTLKDQMRQLASLLKSARRLETNNNFLEELLEDLQQLAYRAENLLDELDYYRLQDKIRLRGSPEKVNCSNKSSLASSSSSYRLASRSVLSSLKGMSCRSVPDALVPQSKNLFSRITLSRRMIELAEQLQKSEMNVRKAVKTEALIITACKTEISQSEATNLRQTSSFLTEPTVFGREQVRDQLVSLLTNEESAIVGKVPVIAVVGNGGVGKTTLARLVFNDIKICSHFVVRLWVCVSTQFDKTRLTREMLEGTFGKRYDELCNLNELQNKLKNGLESKKFLLVLDDMWEDENKGQWDLMVAPLNHCRVKGSIILVTTRKESVAKMVNAKNIPLPGLDDHAFLSFFNNSIFNDPNYGGNSRLKKIGQEIAMKLKGNPLAAKTVCALLKEKLNERDWMKIRDSEEWKSQSGPEDIMPALRLSYEHMPFHLQRCFSYCAIFPEDNRFTPTELVYLWMAQGFLEVRSEGKSYRMEDIGSVYFNDLFNRGFFQTIQSRSGGTVFFTFHDLIYELACTVSFKECLTINAKKPRQTPATIRHLSIFSSSTTKKGEHDEAIIGVLDCLDRENLSTVLLTNWHASNVFQRIPELLKETKFLRALRLNQCFWVPQHNFNFQNFVSLRYLRLIISSDSKTLPNEICRLYHLEVFELKAGLSLDKLPNNFSDLVSLRHFDVEGDLHSKIRGVGKLTSLQELNYFNVQQNIGFEMEQLASLKEIGGSLQISNLENVKSMEDASNARLADKEELDALYLQWNHGDKENTSVLEGLKPSTNLKSLAIVGYGGVTSPTWLEPSLNFLESLTLEGCEAWELLPPIGELEFLKYLKLSGLAVREIGPQCYGTSQSMKFQSLEELQIIKMPHLEKWVWSDQLQQFLSFKKLREITIKNCTKLVDLPLSGCATSEVLERFPSLEKLGIHDCPLIFQLPPLPYSSLLSSISIERTESNESLLCWNKRQNLLGLQLDKYSSLNVGELLAFHDLSSLRFLEITNIACLESLDLHSLVALEMLVIKECQSLNSLIFGEHLGCLMKLKIISCKTLASLKGLRSWVNLKGLHFSDCPGFIAAWDFALKEIQSNQKNFSLSLAIMGGDSLSLLTLPIIKQLTSLQIFDFEFSAFTEEHKISPQLLTSLELINYRGSKNLVSFPFDLFPSLQELRINFPQIQSLSRNSRTKITEECLKLRNIKEVHIEGPPVKVKFVLSSEEIKCKQMDTNKDQVSISSPPKPIVIVGSASTEIYVEIDHLPMEGESIIARSGITLPGGMGANQAFCSGRLSRSDHATYLICRVGSDAHGKLLKDSLGEGGAVCLNRLICSEHVPTGHAVVMLQPNGQNSIIIVGGANMTGWDDKLSKEDLEVVRGAGMLLLQHEIPDFVNLQVAQVAKSAGVPVMMDAGGMDKPIPSDLYGLIDILSPNETELARITGMLTDTFEQISQAATKCHKMGVKQVLVKLGSQGSALFIEGEETIRQPVIPASEVVDTMGVGDAFTAAFAVALVEGRPRVECLKFAAAAASLCVEVKGAMPSMPHRNSVMDLLKSI